MKNYSFSNIAEEDSLTRKTTDLASFYRHSELKATEASQRIEEIKKKYDTPSRRQRLESLKKSQDFCLRNKVPPQDQNKENAARSRKSIYSQEEYLQHPPAPTFGNPLKESFALQRLEKSAFNSESQFKQLEVLRKQCKRGEGARTSLNETNFFHREEEQALFSKVREMKESLISKEFGRGSMNGRNSVYSSKQNQCFESGFQRRGPLDPRVENIDKINSKIKQILNCLAENDKNPSKFIKESQKNSYDFSKNSAFEDKRSQSSLAVEEKENYQMRSFIKEYSPLQKKQDARSSIFFTTTNLQGPSQIPKKSNEPNILNFPQQNSNSDSILHNDSLQNQYAQSYNATYCKNSTPNARSQNKCFDLKGNSIVKNSVEAAPHRSRHIQVKSGLKSGLQVSRSRSQIAVTSKSFLGEDNRDVLKSGKKLNEEINKIQSKIQEMEKQKKNLNIEFTPFSMKNRSVSTLAAGAYVFGASADSKGESGIEKTQPKSVIPHFRSASSAKDYNFSGKIDHLRYSQPKISSKLNIRKEGHQQSNGNACLQKIQIDIKTVRIHKEEDNNQELNINARQSEEIREQMVHATFDAVKKRTNEGILDRKKKLNYQDKQNNMDSLKKLVDLLTQQAKVDEKLRNMKMWLCEVQEKNKFAQLSAALQQAEVSLSVSQCQTLFKVQESEHNPFFTLQDVQGSFKTAASAYLEANNHWASCVKGKFSRQKLLSEGFTQGKIDLQKKGYIQLEDLVRLLNIESGTFYRNRDIFLIFRRLTRKDKASFQEILEELCN